MKKWVAALAVVLVVLLAYLLLWPSPIVPRRWTPPPAPSLKHGPYATNDRLDHVQRLAVGVGRGPEGIAVDAAGRVYAGYEDGRVIMLSPDGASYQVLGDTGGRPLGIAFGPTGGVLVADAVKGLLLLGAKPQPMELADAAAGRRFGFTNDVDDARLTHQAFFTDSSWRFRYPDFIDDILEHAADGRLLRYDFDTKTTTVLLDHLHFANGVAVGPDDAYVLVAETSAYRIVRYWLKGPKAGSSDVFVDDLPGFPDNLSFNGRDRFWVALYAPRNALLDRLADKPWLRALIAKLPAFLQPAPQRRSFVLAFDLDGKLVANLQYAGADAYAPITSVQEHGPWLWLGSKDRDSIARIPLARVFPGAPPPPPGWRDAPPRPRATTAPKAQAEGD